LTGVFTYDIHPEGEIAKTEPTNKVKKKGKEDRIPGFSMT